MATTSETVPQPLLRLPDDPSLEQLRNQARDLQRGVRGGDLKALDLLAAALPERLTEPADRTGFALSAAQLAIARAYGYTSWPKLRAHLDVIARWRWDPLPEPPAARGGDVHDRFLDLACLVYSHDDHPARRGRGPGVAGRRPRAAHAFGMGRGRGVGPGGARDAPGRRPIGGRAVRWPAAVGAADLRRSSNC